MFPRYLQYLLTDFRQTFVTGTSRNRGELITFWRQKVKVQGHGMTECIPDFHVSTISPVSIDRFLPNLCHWCILGYRWPDYVFGSLLLLCCNWLDCLYYMAPPCTDKGHPSILISKKQQSCWWKINYHVVFGTPCRWCDHHVDGVTVWCTAIWTEVSVRQLFETDRR